jgi:hypothetical protein
MVKELALSEIMEICGPAESVVLHAGEFLFQEGDEAHALYVVKKGVLRPLRRDGTCTPSSRLKMASTTMASVILR